MRGAARCFCNHAREQAELVINFKKLECVASDPKAAQDLQQAVSAKAQKKLRTRNLGVDYSCGGVLGRKVQQQRLKKALERMPFLKRLRQAGARVARLVRSGLVPSLIWGSCVTGLPPRLLHRARRVAHTVCSLHPGGRSLDLSLALEARGTDPASKATGDCILFWLAALMDSWVPRAWQLRAMLQAVQRTQESEAWAEARGPAGAVVASGLRLGWTFPSATEFTTHRGRHLWDKISMGELRVLVDESFDRWRWERARVSLPPGAPKQPPLLEPIRTLRKNFSPQQAGILDMIVEGGATTQNSLYDQRYVVTPDCLLCGERGTYHHRCYRCPATDAVRDDFFEGASAHRWADTDKECMWDRLLVPDPSWHMPRPILAEAVVWEVRPADGYLDELGFGDGSVHCGRAPRAARGGWGLVVLGLDFKETARLHGPVPGWQQDITLAELMAFNMYLRHIGPGGGTFYTDCRNLVIAWTQGEAACTDAFSIYSGQWRQIWPVVHDIGFDNIHVKWIPSHTSKAKAEAAGLAEWQRQGNDWADKQAKKGAKMHDAGGEDVVEQWVARSAFVSWLARFQAAVHVELFDRKLADFARPDRLKQDPAADKLVVFRRPQARRQQRLGRERRMNVSHALVAMGDMFWCRRCGYWSQHKLAKLAEPCEGGAGREDHPVYKLRRQRLAEGIHPITRAPLGAVNRSWLGMLEPVTPMFDEPNAEFEPRDLTRDERAQAAHDFAFIAQHAPVSELEFSRWLAGFFLAVPGAAPKRKKDDQADEEEGFFL